MDNILFFFILICILIIFFLSRQYFFPIFEAPAQTFYHYHFVDKTIGQATLFYKKRRRTTDAPFTNIKMLFISG